MILQMPDNPTTITFKYSSSEGDQTITVPTLTIVPIPNITINSIEIDFNAKISSIETETRSTNSKFGISASVSAKFGVVSAKVNASYSKQSQSKRSGEKKKEYSLHVNVKAGQDDPPPGIDILVGYLEKLAKVETRSHNNIIMITLKDYIGTIVSSVNNARGMADEASAKLAKQYAEDDILQFYTVPRMRMQDIDLEIPGGYRKF